MVPDSELLAYIILSAYALDLLIGDPESRLHPVRWLGAFIAAVEAPLRRGLGKAGARSERLLGVVLVFTVVGVATGIVAALMALSGAHSRPFFILLSIVLAWSVLSIKSLKKEALAVEAALASGRLEEARARLSRIVGRDTGALSSDAVRRAVIETVSENASDAVVAPLFYLALGGPVLAVAYKAVNTLDSMVGYRSAPYTHLGWFSARLDDGANFLPARITAALMVMVSPLAGLDFRRSLYMLRKYGSAHSSPNAGLPQAAAAGALGIRLAGPMSYDGVLNEKPYIGEDLIAPDGSHVSSALRLLELTAWLMLAIAVALLLGVSFVI